jgi:hypothetical protein
MFTSISVSVEGCEQQERGQGAAAVRFNRTEDIIRGGNPPRQENIREKSMTYTPKFYSLGIEVLLGARILFPFRVKTFGVRRASRSYA